LRLRKVLFVVLYDGGLQCFSGVHGFDCLDGDEFAGLWVQVGALGGDFYFRECRLRGRFYNAGDAAKAFATGQLSVDVFDGRFGVGVFGRHVKCCIVPAGWRDGVFRTMAGLSFWSSVFWLPRMLVQ
jgi:hypothetical protein